MEYNRQTNQNKSRTFLMKNGLIWINSTKNRSLKIPKNKMCAQFVFSSMKNSSTYFGLHHHSNFQILEITSINTIYDSIVQKFFCNVKGLNLYIKSIRFIVFMEFLYFALLCFDRVGRSQYKLFKKTWKCWNVGGFPIEIESQIS